MKQVKQEVVIVGSGIGGLVCGAILSMNGFHVTVLERNKQIGGNLQTYARDKCIFDSGVHYVGGLDKGQNLYKIFKYLGIIDKLKMQKLDVEAFDRIVFLSDQKEYKYAQGYDRFAETLIAEFPDEKEAILNYCQQIQSICSKFPMYQLEFGDGFNKSAVLGIDTKAFIDSITDNPRLQNVLAGNNGLYAGIADKTPVYVHALVLNSYIESSWRFIDGGSQIARLLCKIITNAGGVVKNRTEIIRFHEESGLIVYVEDAAGKRYTGDYFISNVHPARTLEMLESDKIRNAYRHRISSLENSISAFMVNITLKPGTMKYEKTNYYCFLNDDVWAAINHNDENWPLSYCLFYSASSKSETYAEAVTLMAYMRFDEVDKWKDSFNTVLSPDVRGEEYEQFKKEKAEKLIALADERFPGLKDAVLGYYCATPLTFRDYMGTHDGSIYGIAKNYKDPLKTFISPRTRIPNLLFTGQNVNLHGVLGVAISSLVTCSEILGMEHLINMINEAQEA
jgi:all-trans-retinol 13,14-reductase